MLGPDPDRPPGAPSTPLWRSTTPPSIQLSIGPEAIVGANDAVAALAPDAGASAGPAGMRSRSSRGSQSLEDPMVPVHRGGGRYIVIWGFDRRWQVDLLSACSEVFSMLWGCYTELLDALRPPEELIPDLHTSLDA